MRLLNVFTLDFEDFPGNGPTEGFVVLSHTWGGEEVSYQEMCWLKKLRSIPVRLKEDRMFQVIVNASSAGTQLPISEEEITRRAGYLKIEKTAAIAKEERHKFIWVDTCCIDKSSSAELQESINSMYSWYRESSMCVVHLEDAESPSYASDENEEQYFQRVLSKSKWVRRGWTLQELIAPRSVSFYSRDWRLITNKAHGLPELTTVTGIPPNVLINGDLSRTSIAQRMSWAAGRSTSRIEDQAYSLMGLFDIQMPMLYGEGEHAFIRLQEEIMKTSSDDSIFAWTAEGADSTTYRGLLARSPNEFKGSSRILAGKGPGVTITSGGLRVEQIRTVFDAESEYYGVALRAVHLDGSHVEICLKKLGAYDAEGVQYARISPGSLGHIEPEFFKYASVGEIRVRQQLEIPRMFRSKEVHSFHLRRSNNPFITSSWNLEAAWPTSSWNHGTDELVLPKDSQDFATIFRLRRSKANSQRFAPDDDESVRLDVLLGFRPSKSKYWCKIFDKRLAVWPPRLIEYHDAAIEPYGPVAHAVARVENREGNFIEVCISIEPGLHNDKICFLVNIDGFTRVS